VVDPIIEMAYYSAYRAGLDYGNSLVGLPPGEELPEDVEQSLRVRARKQAAQLDRMVTDSPEQKQRVAELVDEWMRGEEPLSLNDLRSELATEFSEARALMIARTEVGFAFNVSSAAAMRSAGFEKVRWIAVMDSATCEACQELNDTVMTMDEYMDNALIHPGCSCSAVPADEDESADADLDAAAESIDQEPDDLGAGNMNRDPPEV